MDSTFVAASTSGVGAHALYFAVALVAVAVFVGLYVMVTPYREFALIRAGNAAAAISLGGAIVGYTIPLAKAVAQSEGMMDMMIWAGVALVAQLAAFAITRLVLRDLAADVQQGKQAPAIFLASVSITIGLLNAAAMTA